jgi:hypothetical protein
MRTLELGELNAGFVFFALAIVSTAVFGRFFCGWGCHVVALQDLCAWIMKRLGVKPRPFRSRLLLWAPAALAWGRRDSAPTAAPTGASSLRSTDSREGAFE